MSQDPSDEGFSIQPPQRKNLLERLVAILERYAVAAVPALGDSLDLHLLQAVRLDKKPVQRQLPRDGPPYPCFSCDSCDIVIL